MSNNSLVQIIESKLKPQNSESENAQTILGLSILVKLMGRELTKYLIASTQEEIENRFVEEANEVIQEIQSNSTTTAEAEAKVLKYLQQFN
jgi:hypothetical protein